MIAACSRFLWNSYGKRPILPPCLMLTQGDRGSALHFGHRISIGYMSLA